MASEPFSGNLQDAVAYGDWAGIGRHCGPGVDINQQDGFGFTPLFTACLHGFERCVLEVLGRGGDPSISSNSGLGPLAVAARHNHTGIVAHLVLASGVDPRAVDNRGRCAIDEAAAGGHCDLVEFLTLAVGCQAERKLVAWRAGVAFDGLPPAASTSVFHAAHWTEDVFQERLAWLRVLAAAPPARLVALWALCDGTPRTPFAVFLTHPYVATFHAGTKTVLAIWEGCLGRDVLTFL